KVRDGTAAVPKPRRRARDLGRAAGASIRTVPDPRERASPGHPAAFDPGEPDSVCLVAQSVRAGRQPTVNAATSTPSSKHLVRERMRFFGWLRSKAMFRVHGPAHCPRRLKSMTRPSLAPEAKMKFFQPSLGLVRPLAIGRTEPSQKANC